MDFLQKQLKLYQDQDFAWGSNDAELLRVTKNNNIRFDKNVSNIYLKANRKLKAVTRVAKFVPFYKKIFRFKAFKNFQ